MWLLQARCGLLFTIINNTHNLTENSEQKSPYIDDYEYDVDYWLRLVWAELFVFSFSCGLPSRSAKGPRHIGGFLEALHVCLPALPQSQLQGNLYKCQICLKNILL